MYLDVRTPQEFDAGHAPGAMNVPIMLQGERRFLSSSLGWTTLPPPVVPCPCPARMGFAQAAAAHSPAGPAGMSVNSQFLDAVHKQIPDKKTNLLVVCRRTKSLHFSLSRSPPCLSPHAMPAVRCCRLQRTRRRAVC